MTKKKFNKFLDFVTVLVIMFPLLMALFTARATGSFDASNIGDYVLQYSISDELALLIGDSISTFGFDFDGAFFLPSCVILANALIVWLFRVFIAVMTFLPKMALKLLNLPMGDDD